MAGLPDPEPWRRILESVRLPQQRFREIIEASRVQQQVAGSDLAMKRLREIAGTVRVELPPSVRDTLRSNMANATVQDHIARSIRVPDQRWGSVLLASLES